MEARTRAALNVAVVASMVLVAAGAVARVHGDRGARDAARRCPVCVTERRSSEVYVVREEDCAVPVYDDAGHPVLSDERWRVRPATGGNRAAVTFIGEEPDCARSLWVFACSRGHIWTHVDRNWEPPREGAAPPVGEE